MVSHVLLAISLGAERILKCQEDAPVSWWLLIHVCWTIPSWMGLEYWLKVSEGSINFKPMEVNDGV